MLIVGAQIMGLNGQAMHYVGTWTGGVCWALVFLA